MRKYRKRILFAAAAVVFFPALLFFLLWWDSRPKPDARVSIGYLKTVAQGGSNAVIFVVTNQSDFPVSYGILFKTPYDSQRSFWVLNYPKPRLRGSNSMMSTSLVSVGAFGTNRWRIYIFGSDTKPDTIGRARDWIAVRVHKYDINWAWRLQSNRAKVEAIGPEMQGDYPTQ